MRMIDNFTGSLEVFGMAVALAIAPAAYGAPASWSQLPPYPTPITNNAVTSVCDNDTCTIYSFMGMTIPTNPSSVTPASYKLSTPGGSWTAIADAPLLNGKAKIAASAVTAGGEVYLIGGYTIGGPEITEHRLFRYDPVGDVYVRLADVPTEVDDTVVGVYQDRYIYLISGWHGPINNNTTAVQVYDTTMDTWAAATPIPVPGRFGHAGGLVGDRLVFIDGSITLGNFPIDHSTLVGTIDPADPTSVLWRQNGASPFSQTYRAANAQGFPPGDRIIFVGGTDNSYNFTGTGYNGQPSIPLDQVMAYDPATNDWTLIDDSGGDAHTPTMDHRGLVWFDDKWVTVGGMTGPGSATDAVNALSIPDDPAANTPLPENSLGITSCMDDTACANRAYCVPDAVGGFPGTCHVPKNRYLSVAPNPDNITLTARRLSVVTFNRSCGGAGNTSCISDTECTGNPDGSGCEDVRTGSQVIGWFGQPDAEGYTDVVDEASRHYTIWADLTFPMECGVDELCPAGSHCDTGLGASNTCRLNTDNTEVPSTVVHLSGCHISPKRRDVRAGVGENRAANYYLIEAINESLDIADPSNYSTPLELRTVVVWGDVTGGTKNNIALPPDDAPGFLDILDQVKRFKDKGEATTAWLDLDPQVPNRGVGFLDMLQGVNGFKDQPYPFDDPCLCAGLGPCN